ncbi:hypothetical protein B0H16DRAFT_1477886 [Mycena metata]|uniref:Uncharacterized protein n=1 Tax=Mycena metata TaxID=1033252 RepID=A0AAD7MFZ8_9AGAR|nr:hypothetical protein B0H16DRAFT_1477886 [Mycena metata]
MCMRRRVRRGREEERSTKAAMGRETRTSGAKAARAPREKEKKWGGQGNNTHGDHSWQPEQQGRRSLSALALGHETAAGLGLELEVGVGAHAGGVGAARKLTLHRREACGRRRQAAASMQPRAQAGAGDEADGGRGGGRKRRVT